MNNLIKRKKRNYNPLRALDIHQSRQDTKRLSRDSCYLSGTLTRNIQTFDEKQQQSLSKKRECTIGI